MAPLCAKELSQIVSISSGYHKYVFKPIAFSKRWLAPTGDHAMRVQREVGSARTLNTFFLHDGVSFATAICRHHSMARSPSVSRIGSTC